MKMRSCKLGDLIFKGCRFEIIRKENEQNTVVIYELKMRWWEYDNDGWRVNKQKQIGKFNYLQDAVARMNEIVQINS